jgi:hypothetical protein
MADKKQNVFMAYVTNIKVIVAAVVSFVTFLGVIWTVDDRYTKDGDLESMEARLISEFRSEAADTRVVLIEDMESRLDEFDYELALLRANNQVVPELLQIKRNMLDRRIQRLKNEDNTETDN